MTYDEIHPVYRQALGVFEGLRKLGFNASEIYWHLQGQEMFVVLKKNAREFAVACGKFDKPIERDAWEKEWIHIGEEVNALHVSPSDMDRIWAESLVFRDKMGFVMAIAKKGISLPRDVN